MNKKAEIKNRIDLINRGEVPEGYKNEHGYTIPKDWQELPLIDMCTKRQEKAGCKKLETLSISAGIGFVNQAEKFGRELSGEQYKNYTVIRAGDFSYNKGNSKKYPQGCIYLLKDRKIAAVPNVFNTFRLEDSYNAKYYMHLFSSGYLNKQLFKWINFGVRNDGLLNLYDEDFYKSILPIPPKQEQEKIAKILNYCDKVIELKQKLLEEKNKEFIIAINKLIYKNNLKYPIKKIEEVCEILDNKRIPLNDEERLNIKGSIPYYGANGVLDFINKYIFDEELVLLAEDGGHFDEYYKRPIAQFVKGKSWINNHAHILKAKNKENLYLYFSLVHKNILSILNGAGRAKLNQADLKKIKIPYPEDKKQNEIARILSMKEKHIKLLEQELEQYKQFKKSLSQLLLTGIVRTVEIDCEN